ncbi:MAG: OmpH family outer membrane protein [Verrucomicrobia bacterium]|nr:OmpH family outer membrane protein [Verrucomicrobiota bacterium]
MNVKFFLSVLIATVLAGVTSASAQSTKLGVVDMQECLNKYYKTKLKVKDVEGQAKASRSKLDERIADFKRIQVRLAELDKKARDTALSQEQRQGAAVEMQQLVQEGRAKERELQEAQRKAQGELLAARQQMEKTLVDEVRLVVDAASKKAGLDMVIDKSFLPRGNKVLVVVTDKVPDLTKDVIATLNKDAPAEAPEATDGKKADEKAPAKKK